MRHQEPGIIVGLITLMVTVWGACQACNPDPKPQPEERNRWTAPPVTVVAQGPVDAAPTEVFMPGYLLQAMTAWTPPSDHAFTGESYGAAEARYMEIATLISRVSAHQPPLPNLTRNQGAVLLAAVGSFESGGWRKDVQECRASGDHGRSWTLWQLYGTKEYLCRDPEFSATIALDRLRSSMSECGSLPVAERLAGYASGSCTRGHAESRNRWNRAMNWIAAHPL